MRSIFPLSRWQRNLILLFLLYQTFCKIWKHKWVSFILFRSCLQGKWIVFISTQIMVHDYCIAKYKKFSNWGGLLMTPRATILAIKNIYENWKLLVIASNRPIYYNSGESTAESIRYDYRWKPVSCAIGKNRTISHTLTILSTISLSTIPHIIDVPNKLNKNPLIIGVAFTII